MDASVGAFIAVAAVITAFAMVVTAMTNSRRSEKLQELAREHSWEYAESRDSLAGPRGGLGFSAFGNRPRARDVLSGTYQGRPFVAYEYSYTTTRHEPVNGPHGPATTTRTQTHRYRVWAVYLPTVLPPISLAPDGVLGGISRALGFGGFETGHREFDRLYKVKCDSPDFGARVLHPGMVQLLLSGGAWDWHIDGNAMTSSEKGRLDADLVIPRLEAMCQVIEQIPDEVWAEYGQPMSG